MGERGEVGVPLVGVARRVGDREGGDSAPGEARRRIRLGTQILERAVAGPVTRGQVQKHSTQVILVFQILGCRLLAIDRGV